MPLFEYSCEKCSQSFEKLGKQAEEHFPCPRCGEKARRIVSAFAVSADCACAAPTGSGFR